MKKTTIFASAIALALSMSLSTFAASTTIEDTSSTTIGVSGKYESIQGGADKISVNISWEDMKFTYSEGYIGDWNEDTHQYDNYIAPSWSTNRQGITVTNHSNVDITATFDFTQNVEIQDKTITGSFYTDKTTETALTGDEKKLDLASAVGTTRDDENTAADTSPNGNIYFGISGDGIDSDTQLGSITITIGKKAD